MCLRSSLELSLDGVTNMGRDSLLLDQAESGLSGLRVYSWDGPWVTLGLSQRAERSLLDPSAVPWIKRPTGGKAVLHGHDITIGAAFPLAVLGLAPHELRSVEAAYRAIIRPIVSALRQVGVPAVLGEEGKMRIPNEPTADCFAYSSANDVLDERTGRKIVGCALRLTSSAALVQASLPNRPPLVDPADLFDHPHQVSFTEDLDHESLYPVLCSEFSKLVASQ